LVETFSEYSLSPLLISAMAKFTLFGSSYSFMGIPGEETVIDLLDHILDYEKVLESLTDGTYHVKIQGGVEGPHFPAFTLSSTSSKHLTDTGALAMGKSHKQDSTTPKRASLHAQLDKNDSSKTKTPRNPLASLQRLLPEILLGIAEHLDTISAASLTLVHPRIRKKLANEFFEDIIATRPKRPKKGRKGQNRPKVLPNQVATAHDKFRMVGARQSLVAIYCFYCKKIHRLGQPTEAVLAQFTLDGGVP
jgi:hypothetical protein